jgi:hypothetical protein
MKSNTLNVPKNRGFHFKEKELDSLNSIGQRISTIESIRGLLHYLAFPKYKK